MEAILYFIGIALLIALVGGIIIATSPIWVLAGVFLAIFKSAFFVKERLGADTLLKKFLTYFYFGVTFVVIGGAFAGFVVAIGMIIQA